MAKKRTRAQKIKAAHVRSEETDGVYVFHSGEQAEPSSRTARDSNMLASVRSDFFKTLLSTIIVLGVLLLLFVYTRGL